MSDGAPIAGQNLLEGMVTPDAAGTGVVPATADTWTVSQDGTVYTFHIRSDAKWSDGTPVTAQDFEWTYKRLLTPSTSSLDGLYGSSSYQTDLGIKNAADFQLGKVTDWSEVGVKALDASHLRIDLDTPNANFLQGMAAHVDGAAPAEEPGEVSVLVADVGELGRQRAVRDEVVDAELEDGPRPQRELLGPGECPPGPGEHLDGVRRLTPRGATDTSATSSTSPCCDDPAVFEKDPALSPALTRLDQFSVNFLTLIPSRNPALEDVRVREAIALAIGRAEVAKAGALVKPSTSLVPSTLPGFDASVGFQEDVAKARQLMADAGYPVAKAFRPSRS